MMTLGELIKGLEDIANTFSFDTENIFIKEGFTEAYSYRGSYDELAFKPAYDLVSLSIMLNIAKEAIGKTFRGYKGGDFVMDEWTPVHLAYWGELGESINSFTIRYWKETCIFYQNG